MHFSSFSSRKSIVPEIPACSGYLVTQNLRVGEVLKQRDEIGEGLVKGQHVTVVGFEKVALHAVENGMRGFVRDDVVRQA